MSGQLRFVGGPHPSRFEASVSMKRWLFLWTNATGETTTIVYNCELEFLNWFVRRICGCRFALRSQIAQVFSGMAGRKERLEGTLLLESTLLEN